MAVRASCDWCCITSRLCIVRYFPEIFNASGGPSMVAKYGDWFTYEHTPRANIFRRDHHKVTDMDSMLRLMRLALKLFSWSCRCMKCRVCVKISIWFCIKLSYKLAIKKKLPFITCYSSSMKCMKYNVSQNKTFPSFISRSLVKHCSILIIFGRNIPQKIQLDGVILFLTFPNWCFFSTWGNNLKQKGHILSIFLSLYCSVISVLKIIPILISNSVLET